jgi:hypothetical protein
MFKSTTVVTATANVQKPNCCRTNRSGSSAVGAEVVVMIAHCWLAAEFAVSEPRCCSCCLIRSSCLVTDGHLGEADATDHSAVAAACFTTVGFLDIDCGNYCGLHCGCLAAVVGGCAV